MVRPAVHQRGPGRMGLPAPPKRDPGKGQAVNASGHRDAERARLHEMMAVSAAEHTRPSSRRRRARYPILTKVNRALPPVAARVGRHAASAGWGTPQPLETPVRRERWPAGWVSSAPNGPPAVWCCQRVSALLRSFRAGRGTRRRARRRRSVRWSWPRSRCRTSGPRAHR